MKNYNESIFRIHVTGKCSTYCIDNTERATINKHTISGIFFFFFFFFATMTHGDHRRKSFLQYFYLFKNHLQKSKYCNNVFVGALVLP